MITCPICGYSSRNFKEKIAICSVPKRSVGEKLVRHICPKCDLIFGTQEVLNMTPEQAKQLNHARYTKKDIAQREQSNLERTSLLRILPIKPGDTVLNWGSGPANKLAQKARELFGIEFDNFDPYLHDGFDEKYDVINKYEDLKKYDYIISTNVLEHFLRPIDELNRIKKYLKEGGKMVHRTPCYEYLYSYTKMHTLFLLGRSSQVLADRVGMKLEFLNNHWDLQPRGKHTGVFSQI